MSGNDPENKGDRTKTRRRAAHGWGPGDAVAFEELVEKHQALWRHGRAYVGSNSDVEDIAQQVLFESGKRSPIRPRASSPRELLKNYA